MVFPPCCVVVVVDCVWDFVPVLLFFTWRNHISALPTPNRVCSFAFAWRNHISALPIPNRIWSFAFTWRNHISLLPTPAHRFDQFLCSGKTNFCCININALRRLFKPHWTQTHNRNMDWFPSSFDHICKWVEGRRTCWLVGALGLRSTSQGHSVWVHFRQKTGVAYTDVIRASFSMPRSDRVV